MSSGEREQAGAVPAVDVVYSKAERRRFPCWGEEDQLAARCGREARRIWSLMCLCDTLLRSYLDPRPRLDTRRAEDVAIIHRYRVSGVDKIGVRKFFSVAFD